ncbi:cation:proton antiporter [Actinocorallia aurantiaca]|uniref:Cation/H+ exchanger transmembrane domain-containing protein n=1 Tax=Actinocorallia aurantiaca TaxID=46204 RepID=A0ABN3U8F7_9ACTN
MLRVDLLLLDLVVILVLARLLGAGARLIGQPPVIGEITAGILLGPSLLGDLIGEDLFPSGIQAPLKALADVGLVLFMFVVGLELDQRLVRGRGKVAAGVSLGSTLLPFGLGALLALAIADEHVDGGDKLAFVLFLGAAMSATAFPVLARILTDRGMHRTRLGGLALACAAVIDVLAWTALAAVVALAGSGEGQWKIAFALPFALVMILGVRPALRRLVPAYEKAGRLTPDLLAIVLIGLFLSAWATEWLHVHFIFGAFLFGAVMPRGGAAERLNHEILERLEQLAVLLLLPMFFVVSGFNVDLGALQVSSFGTLAAILFVAIFGKLAGTYAAARLLGVPNRESAGLAALLNTRGLTEIVILSVGLERGILDTELYSLMVLMALLTTAMTGPLLSRLYPRERVEAELAETGRLAPGEHRAHRIMVIVDDLSRAAELAAEGAARAAGRESAELVLAHLRPYPVERLEVGLGLSSELAEMADTLSVLKAAAASVSDASLSVQVISRFSADVEGELAGLLTAAAPDEVLGAPMPPAPPLPRS